MNLCLPISFYILICTQVCACLKNIYIFTQSFLQSLYLPSNNFIQIPLLRDVGLGPMWCFLFSHFNSVPFVSALLLTQTAHLQYTMATLNTQAVCLLSQLPFVCSAPTLISLKHMLYNTMNAIKYTYLFQEKNLLSFISSKQAVSCLFSCQGPVTIFFIAASKYLKFSYQKNSVHNERFID